MEFLRPRRRHRKEVPISCKMFPFSKEIVQDSFDVMPITLTADEVLEKSDIISLHRPASGTGEPVITGQIIAKMKRGVFIINTSRASLIDENALLAALESNQVAGLATDVYAQEPPDDYSLVKHDRVIATPHLGGFTGDSVDRATTGAVENIINTLHA